MSDGRRRIRRSKGGSEHYKWQGLKIGAAWESTGITIREHVVVLKKNEEGERIRDE